MSEERLNEIKDSIELQMQVQQAVGYKNRYDGLLIEEIDLYNEVINLQQENNQLQTKYNKVLTMLANHYPPCEIDGFMDKNTDYCSINCGVDEEIFKECWDRYITQSLEGNDE